MLSWYSAKNWKAFTLNKMFLTKTNLEQIWPGKGLDESFPFINQKRQRTWTHFLHDTHNAIMILYYQGRKSQFIHFHYVILKSYCFIHNYHLKCISHIKLVDTVHILYFCPFAEHLNSRSVRKQLVIDINPAIFATSFFSTVQFPSSNPGKLFGS